MIACAESSPSLTSIHSPIRASAKQNLKLYILPRFPHMMLTVMLLMLLLITELSQALPAPPGPITRLYSPQYLPPSLGFKVMV